MSRSNIKRYIYLAVVAILAGCGQLHQPKKYDDPENEQQLETGKLQHTDSNQGAQSESGVKCSENEQQLETGKLQYTDSNQGAQSESSIKRSVFVILHGMEPTSDNAERHIADRIKENFEGAVILEPKCRRVGAVTRESSISEQAKEVVAEIKLGIKELPNDIPIHLIGYSQGGVVASIIARDYSTEFNIATLIPMHAPLSGAPAFNNGFSDVRELQSKGAPGLEVIGCQDSFKSAYGAAVGLNPPSLLKGGVKAGVRAFIGKTDGIEDLRPKSQCTNNIRQFIRKDNQKIPVLLMVGLVDDESLMKTFKYTRTPDNDEKVTAFCDAYAKFTTREENGIHDILVPLKSQLCRTNSFDNLNYESSAHASGVYPPNVSIHLTKNELHSNTLIAPLMRGYKFEAKRIFDVEESMTAMVKFLKLNDPIKSNHQHVG